MDQLAMWTEAEVPERRRILVINLWAPAPGPPCERCGPDCCGTRETDYGWACNGSCDYEGRHDDAD
jgi:hypothetical protein